MLRNNSQTANPITIGGKDIEEVTEFTYLGAKVSTDGNSESEVKARIRKARGAFAALKNIWKTNKISNRTKIRLFKSNVLSVLNHGKVTKSICQMLEVFQNKCLRKILRIYWPNKISNTDLHERTGMQPISLEVKRRRWKWIGYVCRMPLTSIPRVAMRWTPGGKRAKGGTKGDVEEISRAGDEGSRVELGPGDEACNGQATLAFCGVGLMCDPARRGLSK